MNRHYQQRQAPQLSREELLVQAKQIDSFSSALINVGVTAVKRHPIPVSLYVIGLFLCLLFNGIALSPQQEQQYHMNLNRADTTAMELNYNRYVEYTQEYHRTKGWLPWSCDEVCTLNYNDMMYYKREYELALKDYNGEISNAKSEVGLFSTVGVAETRELFWTRFDQGKKFATRQSKWDLLFIGLSSMRRDEHVLSYMLRALMSVLMNITIGIFGAIVSFIWSLYGLIVTYQANIVTALIYFMFASVAACSFGMTFVVGMYVVTAGTVYVGAKLISSQYRLEAGRQDRNGYIRR